MGAQSVLDLELFFHLRIEVILVQHFFVNCFESDLMACSLLNSRIHFSKLTRATFDEVGEIVETKLRLDAILGL